jgi:hypothetical protein
MKISPIRTIKIAALSILAIAPVLSMTNSASAYPKYRDRAYDPYAIEASAPQSLGTDASYLGAGISGGLTTDNGANGQAKSGGSVYGRYAIPNSNVSARAGVVFTDKISAFTPKVTYDVGVAPGTNVYAGVGYNFVNETNGSTPLGNKNAAVLSLGAESQLANNVVIFGSADLGLNAYQNSNNSAIALQGGAGFRF